MSGDPTQSHEDVLHLQNHEQVEIAWLAVNIAGGAPTIGPLLGSMIELLPPASAPLYLQNAVGVKLRPQSLYS